MNMPMKDLLIYGATGYTGTLVAEHAAAVSEQPPALAGRSEGKVRSLARRLEAPWTAFSLEDPAAIRRAVENVAAVLNLAGPFSKTTDPLVAACLACGTHYVDITGEIAVFERLAALDTTARKSGVVLLPGAGFDVVPSDCLAAHLKRRQPGMHRLRLSIAGLTQASRGTARTAIEALGRGTMVRRGGRIVELENAPRHCADFGEGPVQTVGVSWGDVATAWHSTGAQDIDVLFEASFPLRVVAGTPPKLRPILASQPVQDLLKRLVGRITFGPSAKRRGIARGLILGEAWDSEGERVASLMQTPDPYELTAQTAFEIARRVAAGEVTPGYHTPSNAFGADLALDFRGITRTDI